MLSKNKIKLIQSLNRKKDRDESGLFLIEGNKMVEEAFQSDFIIETLVCTDEFLHLHPQIRSRVNEIIEADSESIQKASLLQNPQDSLALIRLPSDTKSDFNLQNDLVLAFDFIQDPGNLGTILRIADWFGIRTVICSENTVDAFNPKVVQASMGAIFRVNTWYTSLEDFLAKSLEKLIPVYGTFLEGKDIYTEKLSSNGIIILGNEGNGISDPIRKLVTHKLLIPSFSSAENKPESLNVAIATAICCSEFRRR
jgi:TrmH family RNA methyltransferase